MKLRVASHPTVNSFSDGPGIRYVIWIQGCPHHCKGCHNPQTHDYSGGELIDISEICEEINQLKYHRGITLSGGEPFEQPQALLATLEHIHPAFPLDIWCYTGYLFEDLLKDNEKRKLLEKIDVIVDGMFDISQYKHDLWFKGSENQRIIDVQKSLKSGKIEQVKRED